MGIQFENLLGLVGENDVAGGGPVIAGDDDALGAVKRENRGGFQSRRRLERCPCLRLRRLRQEGQEVAVH